jgi:hypothetical protein
MSKKFLGLTISAIVAAGALSPAMAATDSESGIGRHAAARVLRPTVPRRPIAYGTVFSDGTVESGTGNFTATWDSTNHWYAIHITGQNYFWLNYTTELTTSLPQGNGFCQVDSVSGNLLVRCYNLAGQPQQAVFDFHGKKARGKNPWPAPLKFRSGLNSVQSWSQVRAPGRSPACRACCRLHRCRSRRFDPCR